MKKQILNTTVRFKDVNKVTDKLKEMMNESMANPLNNVYGPSTKNIVVTYDSETTNAVDNGIKKPYVYSYCVSVMTLDGRAVTVQCSKLKEFVYLVKYLCKIAKCSVSHHLKRVKKDANNGTDDHNQYDDSKDVYLNIYVHNLPFDYSFLYDAFDIRTLFCSSAHKPYYVLTWDGAKFIDTVVLTQKTLDEIGKSLRYFDIKKMVGDLDYNKIRNSKTKLTDKEIGYIQNDTLTLAAYMCELAVGEYDQRLCDIPLTQTGKVRRFVRSLCKAKPKAIKLMLDNGFVMGTIDDPEEIKSKSEPDHKKGMNAYKIMKNLSKPSAVRRKANKEFRAYCKKVGSAYQDHLKRLTIDTPKDYWQMKETYCGGFTHSNPALTGEVLEDVASFDFTSSYPTVMVSEEFPTGMYARVNYSKDEFLKKLKNKHKDHKAYMFKLSWKSIINNEVPDNYLSSSKVFNNKSGKLIEDDNSSVDMVLNGRVDYCEDGFTYITDVDWETITQAYDIEEPEFSDIMEFNTSFLPQPIVMSIFYLYEQKTKLKHVKGKERDYMRSKEQLNGVYGMTVQSPVSPIIIYHKDEHIWSETSDNDNKSVMKLLDEYNKSAGRFLYYPWGIYTAAYARRNLWKGIIACGSDYIYSDTDSVKILHKEKHMKFINEYNEKIVAKIHKVCDYYKIPYEKSSPKDINGISHQLGIWDADDGFYSYFKTLGAKRYIDVDKDSDEFESTIAGLSKTEGSKWMIEKSGVKHEGNKLSGDVTPLFDLFNDNMTVPAESTGKMSHTYVNYYNGFDIKDFQGNVDKIPNGMGCFLENAGFTLNMDQQFMEAAERFKEGYRLVSDRELSGL